VHTRSILRMIKLIVIDFASFQCFRGTRGRQTGHQYKGRARAFCIGTSTTVETTGESARSGQSAATRAGRKRLRPIIAGYYCNLFPL